MKHARVFLVALGALAVGDASRHKVTPVQKVLKLMEEMTAKGKAEMKEEKEQYTKYKQFCDDTLREKKRAIVEATDNIELLSADIEKAESTIDDLAYEIGQAKAVLETATKEKDEATKVRKEEKKIFDVTEKDYSESIDALNRAMKTLKANKFDRAQVESLVQLTSKIDLPDDTKHSLDAFLMTGSEQPAAVGYETQSGGIIEMLQELRSKFVKEKMDLQKAEAQKKHSYGLLSQSLDQQISQSSKDIDSKTRTKGKTEEQLGANKGDLKENTVSKADDTKYSEDLQATCEKKAAEFKDRSHLREQELEAIGKATDIIRGSAVSDAAEKHLPKLLQKKTSTALWSLRGLTDKANVMEPKEIVSLLQGRAKASNSRILSALADRVSKELANSGEDPFEAVSKMIQDLIKKLKEQALAEATKKAYCDKAVSESKITRREKTAESDSLKAELDECNSLIAQLAEETVTLSKEIKEISEAVAKATELRQKEKLENTHTMKEAKDGQKAVASAIAVLNEFYAKASSAASFLQLKSQAMAGQPEIFESEGYTGMTGAKGGVIGMMEVIESDFARLLAETSSEEAVAAKEYKAFMDDSKMSKTEKNKDLEHKRTKKSEKESESTSLDADLQGTLKELDAANQSWEKIRGECETKVVDQATRVEQREKEIEELEAALEALTEIGRNR
eukprot:TRINITY_DN2060_c0_g2_i1.p1 TRINITY_DN2060_c0_g2~~TRINITY_DN2060_c0_g2_i1.p1  ORF type:complete len:679 (-),score=220.13 TRINITY_DN2060_c0_g2_i1:157-2193(-)